MRPPKNQKGRLIAPHSAAIRKGHTDDSRFAASVLNTASLASSGLTLSLTF